MADHPKTRGAAERGAYIHRHTRIWHIASATADWRCCRESKSEGMEGQWQQQPQHSNVTMLYMLLSIALEIYVLRKYLTLELSTHLTVNSDGNFSVYICDQKNTTYDCAVCVSVCVSQTATHKFCWSFWDWIYSICTLCRSTYSPHRRAVAMPYSSIGIWCIHSRVWWCGASVCMFVCRYRFCATETQQQPQSNETSAYKRAASIQVLLGSFWDSWLADRTAKRFCMYTPTILAGLG